ncbi:DUF2892 domain-containing protein [Marinomonas sp. CT5]|uniref:YgaP family membrane protein n=1 Tax=Marinomonas sp. CT5 TaxID=2066133 RepID=UPI001BB0624D|nr:DUF2892 domain-containing protein [Marinomonas sp. CT5]QUX97321.1 DUF2892 domain-containing protein [Marinomonas sp. CT5]
MKRNLHPLDRVIRGVIGIIFTGLALLNGDHIEEPILEASIGLFGVLNLISLFSGWCPIYHVAGISTCKDK